MDLAKLFPDVPTHKVVQMPTVPIHKIEVLPSIQTKKGKQTISNDDVKKHNAAFMKTQKEKREIEKELELKLSKLRNEYYNNLLMHINYLFYFVQ